MEDMQSENTNYFLFPHLTLSDQDRKDLFVFLPNLSLMQVVRPPFIPDLSSGRFSTWRALDRTDLAPQIESCINGYRAFAEIHGSSGALAFLAQAMSEESETRFLIQEGLRGTCPPGLSALQKQILEAAVFLELARDLDEKELELEAGYDHLNTLEKELQSILGVTGDEELDEAGQTISPPLSRDRSGLGFMLSRRVYSWLRLFFAGPMVQKPVFVTTSPEAVDEIVDLLQREPARAGRQIDVVRLPVGSFPRLDQLGEKQLQSFSEAPAFSGRLSEYWRELDALIEQLGEATDLQTVHEACAALNAGLAGIGKGGEPAASEQMTLSLVMPWGITLHTLYHALQPAGLSTSGEMAGSSRPAIFLCLA